MAKGENSCQQDDGHVEGEEKLKDKNVGVTIQIVHWNSCCASIDYLEHVPLAFSLLIATARFNL